MIQVGTSGWQYRDWRGRFYPRGLAQVRWLEFFSRRFPTVEVNNSFYRLPSADAFAKWRRDTPGYFVVTVKASRYITHIRRLREQKDSVDLFWSRAVHLGDKLGPVLFQLPPRFRADVPLLAEFIAVLPKQMRAAFEFRDASWETDDVYSLLDRAGYAYVLADRPGWRVRTVVTGGWSYLRFHEGGHGSVGSEYTLEKLRRWADRIAEIDAEDVYVYFNNDPDCAAIRDAARMMRLLEQRGRQVARAREAPLDWTLISAAGGFLPTA